MDAEFWNFAVQAAKNKQAKKFEYVRDIARKTIDPMLGFSGTVFNNVGFVDGYAVVELAGLFFFTVGTPTTGSSLYVSFDEQLHDRFPISSAEDLGETLIIYREAANGEKP